MTHASLRLSKGGRLVIPVEFRRALEMQEGTPITLTLEDGSMRIRTLKEGIRRAQELIAKYDPHPGVSMVDSLIADRRAEALKEELE